MQPIIIVGAGKRVVQDVVPALELLDNAFEITGIYARAPGTVFGRRQRHDVEDLAALDERAARRARYIYLAVPPVAVRPVLEKLLPHGTGAELIIDTPAPLSWRTRSLLAKFRNVHVAQDTAYLPWLDAMRARAPRHVDCDQSLCRDHGIALLKAMCGSDAAPARVGWGWRGENTVTLRVGAAYVRLIEAYRGELTVDGRGVDFPRLTAQEVELVGGVRPQDTVVTRMPELKRIGLVRMLALIAQGREPWPLAQGVDDAWIDHMVRGPGFFLSLMRARRDSARQRENP